MSKLYTAVGLLQCKGKRNGLSFPVVFAGNRQYNIDYQELLLWTILSWSILNEDQMKTQYEEKARQTGLSSCRGFSECLYRLIQRGLVVSGTGETEEDALYHLLSCLCIVPVSQNFFLRAALFMKQVFANKIPASAAKQILQRTKLSECEHNIMKLSKKALLSTAEIIKCMEKDAFSAAASGNLMSVLYGDEITTSDNIAGEARCMKSRQPVILAVANLYLRRQIVFDRGDFA